MAQYVNLDALIPREDFDVVETSNASSATQTIQIRDLERGAFFCATLRKPDFQRETSEWTPEKISQFVESFLEGDLIPALILWQSSGSQIFLLDGAHRLSALMAWVQNDYGDGKSSRDFFEGVIPSEQIAVAERTRTLIRKRVGSYEDHQHAISNPEKAEPEVVQRAKRLGSLALQVQWVKGDAKKAEASFFKINQQAAPIDATELRLLKARTLPNAVAARAIIRAGTGHKYWSKFDETTRKQVESLAKEINNLLFTPELKTPIKTLDLPVAGRGYSSRTLPLVFDFVNISNSVTSDKDLVPDLDGSKTVEYLRKCRSLVNRMTGTNAASLGLHPAVYFYSASGRYQPTAFLAMLVLIKELDQSNGFRELTRVRQEFENFLIQHKILVNQVTLKHGSGIKGYLQLNALFKHVLDELKSGTSQQKIALELGKVPTLSYLQPAEVTAEGKRKDFDDETKSAVFLRDALKEPMRCRICNGLLHFNSITTDHIERKADGGLGVLGNGQLAHPLCNTTIKQ